MKKKKEKSRFQGICTYCGEYKPLTIDHVPPQCLFGTPKPIDLIKVPSCNKCNQSFSKNDEYFKLVLSLREKTGNHPTIKTQILPSVLRSLEKPRKQKFTQNFLASLQTVNFSTHLGIFTKVAYSVDIRRICKTTDRITKGLYFNKHRKRLAINYDVVSIPEQALGFLFDESNDQITKQIIDDLLRSEAISIGNKIFSFWYITYSDDPNISAWLYSFYDDALFLCFTLHQEVVAKITGNKVAQA